MKKHTITLENPIYQPAYLSNGVVGLRVKTNPFIGQTALLSGFTGSHERFGVEALAPVPAIEYNISMDGASMGSHPQGYTLNSQSYDFSNGELYTDFTYENPIGRRVSGSHLIYCSRTLPSIVIQQIELRVMQPCRLQLTALMEPSKLAIHTLKTVTPKKDCDGVLLLSSRDHSTTAGVATYLEPLAEDGTEFSDFSYEWGYEEERLFTTLTIAAHPGQWYRFNVMTSYVPGALHSEPHWQAVRMVKLAKWRRFDRLRQENRKAWADLWRSRITIEGAGEEWQDIVDASFFYLYTSLSAFAPQTAAPFGLSRRDEYKGHAFWDTESFMFILPLMTSPDIARNMLEYRFERLSAARHNAMINGLAGVQFPWQSGQTGDEVTRVSAGGAGGAGEQHVNMDVAMAFVAYAKVSDDPVFLRERAWPVLKGVADWIVSRVEKTVRGYEILFVTGIDEQTDNVDNDAFTNIMCSRVLRFANECAQRLGYPANPLWQEIAGGLFIPIHEQLSFIEQYEHCPIRDSMPPEMLMAYFPYGYRHSDEVDENTYRFYLERDFIRYLSYPMLSGFLGVIPARLGDRKLARECFDRGNLDFFIDPYLMCTESACAQRQSTPVDRMLTIFLTGRGSLMSGLLLGLTGLDIWEDGPDWLRGPVVLPEGWDSITLGRVYIKGKPARVIARHGSQSAQVEWL